MTRQIKRIIAVMMALSLTAAATVTVSAKDTSSMTVDDVVSAFHNSDVQYFNLESMTKYNDYNLEKEKLAPNRDPAQEITDALPSKLDLRNVDGKCYVSPVKNQDPWPTCWSFGAVAAAETSIAYALGHDYNDKNAADADMFDLSERHLAWFMYNALPEGPADIWHRQPLCFRRESVLFSRRTYLMRAKTPSYLTKTILSTH